MGSPPEGGTPNGLVCGGAERWFPTDFQLIPARVQTEEKRAVPTGGGTPSSRFACAANQRAEGGPPPLRDRRRFWQNRPTQGISSVALRAVF